MKSHPRLTAQHTQTGVMPPLLLQLLLLVLVQPVLRHLPQVMRPSLGVCQAVSSPPHLLLCGVLMLQVPTVQPQYQILSAALFLQLLSHSARAGQQQPGRHPPQAPTAPFVVTVTTTAAAAGVAAGATACSSQRAAAA